VKTIVITGGTGGLGQAVVRRLATDYQCLVPYRTRQSFESLEGVTNVTGLASLDELGGIDLHALVHLAGAFATGRDEAAMSSMLEANLMSFVRALDVIGPRLVDGGRIVAISAAATKSLPSGLGAYNAAKSALNALVGTLAHELAGRDIAVNALLPTALDTPAMRSSSKAALVPLERVAEWVAFMLGDHGRGITGQLVTMA
jgi:3-oxoacyl-[acyl-carrier protein] reductase